MRDFFKPGIDDAETDSSIGLSDLEDQVFQDNVFSPAAGDEDNEEHIEEVDMNDPDFDCETDDDSDEDDDDDSDDSDDTDEDENDNRNSKPGTSSDRANNSDLDDEDEEDETVRAIIAAIKKPRSHPPEIKVDDFVTDISFHPDEDIIAIGNILGDIVLYKYTNEENTLLNTFEVHTNSCRDVEFSEDGRTLLSGSKDKAIMVTDVETGKLVKFYDGAHNAPIYKLYVIDENLFSTGDDSGTVKVWDIRTQDSVFSIRKVEDCITAMLTNDSKKLLLCTSGDGYLTTISIGARKMYVQSEPYAEELTCMGLYRNDSKLVVGTSKGKLYTFNWGQFGYHCDMFPGMKTPINVMLPLTDRIGCVGGEEGILRAAHVAPFRNLGIVGQHTLPVESMDINHSGELIASSSHNNDVRFWNIKYFEDFGDIKYNEKHNPHKEKQHNLPSSKFSNATDFFADLA